MKIIKENTEVINEETSSDALYDKMVPWIADHILNSLDAMIPDIAEKFPEYNINWKSKSANNNKIQRAVQAVAETFSENLLWNAPDVSEDLSLNEKLWKHKLSNGLALRSAIDIDDLESTYAEIEKSLAELKAIFNKGDEHDIDDMQDQLMSIDFDEDDEEDIESILNDVLYYLYSFCDDHNVWIPLE